MGSQTTEDFAEVETVPTVAPTQREVRWELGTHVGRYRVEREIGRGGMGIVLRGHDPQLDRTVAIKLVVPRPEPSMATERTRLRLLGEARALARLTHPNIVEVFDVGRRGDLVWLAMELIDGQTLRSWAQRPRSWRDKVGMLAAAGRGLAAAHAAGVVHRDVKPDNVLLGTNGRVAIADFGLAMNPHGCETPTISSSGAVPALRASEAIALTRPGSVMGTPGYMSPEQRRGLRLDPRSDQYSFCVMAHELLFGTRPGDTRTGLPAEDADAVPSAVRAAIARGLQPDPNDRFASMDALLTAMHQRRPRGRLLTVLAGAAAIAATVGFLSSASAAPTAPNDQATAAWPTVIGHRARIDAVNDLIDEGYYGEAAAEARRIDRRTQQDAPAEVRASASLALGTTVLLSGDAAGAEAELERAYLVADAAGLGAIAGRSAIALAQAVGAQTVRPDEARAWLRRAASTMARMDSEPELDILLAQASGAVELTAGELQDAQAHFERALEMVSRRHGASSDKALVALSGLATLHGLRDDHGSAAKVWRRAVDIQRDAGRPEHPRLATLLTNLGIARARLERYDEARDAFTQVRTMAERDPSSVRSLAHALNGLAVTLTRTGEPRDASRVALKAAKIMAAKVGDHPWVANCHANAGEAFWSLGQLDDSEREFSRAHVMWQSTLGGDTPVLANAELGLGRIAVARGNASAGAKRLRRALELSAERDGNQVRPAEIRLELARALQQLGDMTGARDQAERALAQSKGERLRKRAQSFLDALA